MRNKQDLSQNRHAYDLNNVINECKLKKKKYFVSKLARIFQTDAACIFFIFILFYFLLQLAFASTHIRNQKWLKSFNFRIFRNQTGFYTFFELPRA